IVPDTNGSFSVSCSQYTGTIPGGVTAGGAFGVAPSAIRLEESDPGQPRIVSVNSTGSQMRVVFSVPVMAGSVTNPGNYSVSNLLNRVLVMSAAPGTDPQTVQLTTAGQLPFMPHWITVKGIADASTGT